jgi:hypothetical protein
MIAANNTSMLGVVCDHPIYFTNVQFLLEKFSAEQLSRWLKNTSNVDHNELWSQYPSPLFRLKLLDAGLTIAFDQGFAVVRLLAKDKLYRTSIVDYLQRAANRSNFSHTQLINIIQLCINFLLECEQTSNLLASLLKSQSGCKRLLPLFVAASTTMMSLLRVPTEIPSPTRYASSFFRLVTAMTSYTYKSCMKKHAIVLLTNYISIQRSVRPFATEARSVLTEIAYEWLDVCALKEKEVIVAQFDSVGKSLFRHLHSDYQKYHQFKGNI